MLDTMKAFLLFISLAVIGNPGMATETPMPQVGIEELEVGTGTEATAFSVVEAHYTGKLTDGTVFDSSLSRGEPIKFTLGAGQVIPGWDMGLQGMRVEGRRILNIPSLLGYGPRGAGGVIPPNADLVFEVELVSVVPAPFANISNTELQAKLDQGIKLIDIRRPDEWQETGVVEGSIKLTAFDDQGRFLRSFIDGLEDAVSADEEILLICRTGNRTATLSNWMATQGGYDNVVNVQYGITSWIADGRPVDKVSN